MRRILGSCALLFLAGCADDTDLGPAKVRLFTGLETDGWSAPPAVRTVEVVREDIAGEREEYVTLDVPDDAEPLSFTVSGGTAFFEATGYDDEDEPVLGGRSFLLYPDGLRGTTVPLFVGRKRRFSRPGELAGAPGEAPALGLLGGRFLLTTAQALSSVVNLHSFDFGLWYATGTDEFECPTPGECAVRSMAIVNGTIAILVADEWATWTDFSTTYSGELTVPSGLDDFADVAGGATVDTADLRAYVVGPTRAEATDAVLRVALDGALSGHATLTPRAGAAATWVEERGLVVAGGSAEGAGVEVLGDEAREFVALPFPADPTTGAALVPIDGSIVMRVGGVDAEGEYAPTVAFDLGCTEDCTPTYHSAPIELTDVQAFRLEERILAVGTDADGLTSGRLLEADGVTAIELRQRRSGARALMTYLGSVVVAGGTLETGGAATSIELFIL